MSLRGIVAKESTPMTAKKTLRKSPTNIVLPAELKRIAERYFGATKHRSLSGFVESALQREFAKNAKVIRAIGLQVPESVTTK